MDTYKKINWENSSSTATPLSAENLNHMDDGIEAATTAITKIETDIAKKANTTEVNAVLSKKADKTSVDSALALKQNISNMFSTKQNLTDKESSYPSVKYLENYYYNMDDVDDALALKANTADVNSALSNKADKAELTAGLGKKMEFAYLPNTITNVEVLLLLNGTDTVYTGIMSGFSTKFGASSDDVAKGFRMWLILSEPYKNGRMYRVIMLDDGSVWTASLKGTTFTQIIYNKTQIDQLLKSKADTATTLAGYGIKDAYTKTEVDTAFLNNTTTIYLKNTITDIDSFLECDSTDKIYIGMMKGFSTTFGYSSDTESKGFRMWFIPELVSGEETSTEIGTPIVQSWHRVVMFEDGTIWTAPFRNTTFTQISYSKTQVENLLADKAGLDAYENVVRLSTTVSTADRLNDCTNANKTYVFNVVPPMSTDLAISTGCNCIVNCYDNLTQILRTVRYQNKVFIREYNSTSDTWSDFKEITIPDKAVTKEKLSADLRTELAGKYDASNVEYGSGTLTGAAGYENESGTFNYQKVGNLVTVIGKATFSGENTTLVRLAGLPYMPTSETMFVYTQHFSSKSKWMMVNTNYSVLEVRPSTSGEVFEANETLRFAISYYTA